MAVKLVHLISIVFAGCFAGTSSIGTEPNPPQWPDSVSVFKPTDATATIEAKVNAVYKENGGREDNGQFSSDRFAFLFMPGTYTADVPVGYYTQVLGLGSSPTEVVFAGDMGVYCEEGDYDIDVGALDTFWRGAENFETQADHLWTDTKGMLWAVSQAAPLRRLVVTENLKLFEYRGGGAAGYASGGFLADSVVQGLVASGSQQQWLTRTSTIGKWVEGVWNMVFVGVEGAPKPHCGQNPKMCIAPYVVVDRAPLTAGKPFISANSTTGKFSLNIPAPRRNSTGADLNADGKTWVAAPSVDFSSVYVANANNDTAQSINAKLQQGLHVVMSPGMYQLEASLRLVHPNQVLLGLGMATLIPTKGTAAVTVEGNVTGARVSGFLLQAGTTNSPTLLQWGDAAPTTPPRQHSSGPVPDADFGFIHDVFARVGGPALPNGTQARATSMVRIDSNNVIADNMWLWRADHVEGGGLVMNGSNPCDNALVVNGDDVTTYALAAEHTLQDIVMWNGERGSSYFFQAELPYDVQEYPYAGYAVNANVKAHTSYGAGVYHYFRDYAVTVKSGITCPASVEPFFFDALAVFLNGKGTMLHVINDQGAVTNKTGPGATTAWVCNDSPTPSPPFSLSHAATAKKITFTHAVSNSTPSCHIGDSVPCPGEHGAMCAGNECCGQITCPSADPNFMCCPLPKTVNCVHPGPPQPPGPPGPPPPPGPPTPPSPPPPPPSPACSTHCDVGASVKCPGTTNDFCAGSQCCQDGSTCPSASDSFSGCVHPKKCDCTKSD